MAQLSFAFGASLNDPINASLGFTIGWAAPSSAIEDLASKIVSAAAAITATASPSFPLTTYVPTPSQVVTIVTTTTTTSTSTLHVDDPATSTATAEATAAINPSPVQHMTTSSPTDTPFAGMIALSPSMWLEVICALGDGLFVFGLALLAVASLMIAGAALMSVVYLLIVGGHYLWRRMQLWWQRRQQQRVAEVSLLKEAPGKELEAVEGEEGGPMASNEGTIMDSEGTREDDAVDIQSSSSSAASVSDTWSDAQQRKAFFDLLGP